jgi:hypothetical protein
MAVIADVFEALLLTKDTNEAIGETLLQDANIEVTVAENDVNGGQGNQLLGVLHSTRNINVSMNSTQFRMDWLAKNLGQDVRTGAGVAYAMPRQLEVQDDGAGELSITLEHSPLEAADKLAVYKEDGTKVAVTSVAANEVVLAPDAVAAGEYVEVRTYTYTTPAQTEEITIDNKVFARGHKLILQTIEVNEGEDYATHYIQYEFHNAIPTGAFTINTAAERSAQAQPFNLRIVKPKHTTEVGVVRRIPIEQA